MSHLSIETQDRVLTVRFNRTDKKNALTQAMYADAAKALRSAHSRSQLLARQKRRQRT